MNTHPDLYERIAAAEPTALGFDEIAQRLAKPKRVTKGITLSMSAEETIIARGVDYGCGCSAYRIEYPPEEEGMRILACGEEHARMVTP